MKRFIGGLLVCVCAFAPGARAAEETKNLNVNADVQVGKRPGTTEGITIVQPTADGSTRVLSKEVVTSEKEKPARNDVAADTAPRKARLAVVPAVFSQDVRSKFERELNEKWSLSDPSVIENPGYTAFLVDALVNSHKFDVLEREALEAATKEIDFGESDYADLARVVRIGQMVNADYVVIPEIRYMGILLDEREVPYIGKQQQRLKGKISTGVRTVDVKTSRIVASGMDDVGVTNRLRYAESDPGSPVRALVDSLYTASAANEAAKIIDMAYPVKILVVDVKAVVLNRGRGAIEVGEILSVCKPGERMVDPDTKEDLGVRELPVGQVKVMQVDERTSTAEILDGAGAIDKLYICRRTARPSAALTPAAPKID